MCIEAVVGLINVSAFVVQGNAWDSGKTNLGKSAAVDIKATVTVAGADNLKPESGAAASSAAPAVAALG